MTAHPLRVSVLVLTLLLVIGLVVGLRATTSSGGQEHPSPEQLINALEAQLPRTQAELLSDGVLTRQEYEGAIERAAACMEANGLSVTRLPGEGVGDSTQLEVAGDLRKISREQIRASHIGCVDEHQGKLGIIWAELHRPSADEQAAKQDSFHECMTAAGFAHVIPVMDRMLGEPAESPYAPQSPEWNAIFDCQPER